MSLAIVPSQLRALAATQDTGTTQDEPAAGSLPDVIRDAQGREFHLQQDPATGNPQYRHASEQRDDAGNSLTLEILITLAPDGTFARQTTQQLQLVNGDQQREVAVERHGADGTIIGEQVDSFTRQGSKTTTEHTVGTYAAGELVKRETDLLQHDEATDDKTGEQTVVEAKIHGTWENGGEPITDQTIPHVDRTETQKIVSPGQGINKDTPRTITFTSHGAGPLNAIDWDDAGTLVVRFDGRGGQYLEREMRVPLDQTSGAPLMDKAEVTRTDDHQNLVNKGLMQARIWGGLASNVSWILGINFMRGSLGKGFLAFSAAAAGAQLTGEVHAVATRRNDGDWSRVVTSAYDMVLTGLLAAYVSGRPDARIQSLSNPQRLGLSSLGVAGLAINGAEAGGVLGSKVGADALTQRLTDAGIGAQLTRPAASASPLDGSWRLEPRFDAARALLG
ncbi:MAG: hypothetical protein KDC46_04230 [Thermoleophilia bacterium]|nr:hypothetical protein [Thermoleophilia bacterium]